MTAPDPARIRQLERLLDEALDRLSRYRAIAVIVQNTAGDFPASSDLEQRIAKALGRET